MVNIDKIKKLAKQKGIKISFLCQAIGKAHTFLSDSQRGKTTITDNHIAVIASILRTTPEYLRDETDDPAPEQKEKAAVEIDSGLQEVYDIFSALNPENRAKLLELSRLYLDAQSKNGENQ